MARIKRFTPVQRVFHLLLMLSFVMQATTGLSRMYIKTAWGRFLASLFGGYDTALSIHVAVGIFMLALFISHIVYLAVKIDWRGFPKSVYGPDSLLPRLEDGRQILQHIGWMLGINGWPRFDRWGYWEKFDYWAVFWGICILGGTGLVLYNPVFSSRFMPGWVFNVLLWIHRIESILAMGHVFIIHFFIGHLRRHNFPMDLVMFEGSIDMEKIRHERPAWVERLEMEGNLKRSLAAKAPAALRVVYYVFGFTLITGGVYLLINGLIHARGLIG